MITAEQIKKEMQQDLSCVSTTNPLAIEARLKPRKKSAFFTEDPELITTLNKLLIVANTDISVLIYGPSGVGKEAIAYRLHGARAGQFVTVNCGAIPTELLEAEFFGAVKGSYTGCTSTREGYFAHAHEGTLFLDEMGELPLPMQAKLLRALESRTYRAIGSERESTVTCRVVAATNKNIPSLIDQGLFREDLYFRLAKITLDIPSLVDRPGDARLLYCYYRYKVFTKHASKEDIDKFMANFTAPDRKSYWTKGNCRAIISYCINEYLDTIVKLAIDKQKTT